MIYIARGNYIYENGMALAFIAGNSHEESRELVEKIALLLNKHEQRKKTFVKAGVDGEEVTCSLNQLCEDIISTEVGESIEVTKIELTKEQKEAYGKHE